MVLLNEILEMNINKYPDFGYYKLHISKIEINITSNPDIAIETCKSLIEGVSKSILNRIDNTFDEKAETSGRNAKSVQQLFKRALEKLSELNEQFESGFVHSSGQIINITSNIRTERGDISHGKSVPKECNSTPEFSALVANMTDLIISYVLKHFFEIDLGYRAKLAYDSAEMESYNIWLDESVVFPITKARYSQLLYENDYDEYESRYTDEYLKPLESDDEQIEKAEGVEIVVDVPLITIETPEELEQSIEADDDKLIGSSSTPILKEKTDAKIQIYLRPTETQPIFIEELINTYDESTYWTEKRRVRLFAFAETEKLIEDKLKALIDDYLFTNKRPFRDKVVESMHEKPSLKDRAITTDALTEKIIALASELNTLV